VVAGTDIAAEVAACVLFWQRRPLTGLLVRLVPPVAATALMSGIGPAAGAGAPPDPAGAQPGSGNGAQPDPAGAPPAPVKPPLPLNQGIRAAGDALTLWGAWRRSPAMVLAGAAIVAFGWSVHVVGPGAGSGPAGEEPAAP